MLQELINLLKWKKNIILENKKCTLSFDLTYIYKYLIKYLRLQLSDFIEYIYEESKKND